MSPTSMPGQPASLCAFCGKPLHQRDHVGMRPVAIARQPHHLPGVAVDRQPFRARDAAMGIEAEHARRHRRRQHLAAEQLLGADLGIVGVGQRRQRLWVDRALVLRPCGVRHWRRPSGSGAGSESGGGSSDHSIRPSVAWNRAGADKRGNRNCLISHSHCSAGPGYAARRSRQSRPCIETHGSSILADLITAAHRSTSSRIYLEVFSTEPPKISADNFLQMILHLGLTQRLVDVGIDLVGDALRRFGRRHDAVPGDRFETRQRFGDRRHIRQRRQAVGRGDREQFQLAGLDQRQRDAEIVEHHVDVAGEQGPAAPAPSRDRECAAASPWPSAETAPRSDARWCRCLAWRR